MSHYQLVVHCEHLESAGTEDEFNEWYRSHIANLRKLPGVTSVQRSRLLDTPPPTRERLRYLTIYDIQTDDIIAFQRSIVDAEFKKSPTFNDDTKCVGFFEVLDD